MTTFIAICVLITIAAGVLIGTLLVGFLMAWVSGDDDETMGFAWFISSIIAIFSIFSLLCEQGVLE